MSTDGRYWRVHRARLDETRPSSRSLLSLPDAVQMARNLTRKYGPDALTLARARAARAIEVGDDAALAAWQSVIEATHRLLGGPLRS